MKTYIVIIESDNDIDMVNVMDTVSTLFMTDRVIERNLLHLPRRGRYKNKIDLVVESKGTITEYQQKRQEYILREILNIDKATISECSGLLG